MIWVSKPFRVLNCWFGNKEFVKFVKKSWEDFMVTSISDYVLKEKLKLLKIYLKKWNAEVLGRLNLEVEECVEEINRVDASFLECNYGEVEGLMASREFVSSDF